MKKKSLVFIIFNGYLYAKPILFNFSIAILIYSNNNK